MKTKERAKVSVPNVGKDARGIEVRSLRRAGGAEILTPVLKNEGVSGDVDENKGGGFRCQVSGVRDTSTSRTPGGQGRDSAL